MGILVSFIERGKVGRGGDKMSFEMSLKYPSEDKAVGYVIYIQPGGNQVWKYKFERLSTYC